MPNQTQIECYFKSSELAALCKTSKDIVINFKASYLPGKYPTFEISAAGFTRRGKAGKSIKSLPLTEGGGGGGSTGGCPKPC